jgi:hypothetical protein
VGAVVIVNASISFIYLRPVGAKHFQGIDPLTPEEFLGKPDLDFGGRFWDYRARRGFRPLIFGVGAGQFQGGASEHKEHNKEHTKNQDSFSKGRIWHEATSWRIISKYCFDLRGNT